METKKCSRCKEVKSLDEFVKAKSTKDGFYASCKKCGRARYKQYYLNNKEKVIQHTKQYRKNNIEKMKEWQKEYGREYRTKNIERQKQYTKEYYLNNKEKERLRSKKFFENNPNYRTEYNKKWKENNPDYEKIWCRNKRENDPAFRLSKNLSRQIRKSIHKNKDGYHWEFLLGYTLKELMLHLEKQFKEGMTWGNYGEWHMDHKAPVDSFNFSCYEDKEFKECWSLVNLQPLWALENMKKGNRLII